MKAHLTAIAILAASVSPALAQETTEDPEAIEVQADDTAAGAAEAEDQAADGADEEGGDEADASEPSAAEKAAEALAQPTPQQSAAAQPSGTYTFDRDHAQIVFSYDHMGFSTSFGVINGVAGQVTLDPEDPSKSTVSARFPINAIRTISPILDRDLMSADFLDTTEGEVSFASTAVETTGERTARVTGDLTLNGVTKPVVLEVTLNNAGLNAVEQKPAVGFTGTTTILRSDFGLGKFAPAVSDEITIELNIEAMRG